MPRKTPVRELQKEEVAASPLRRSSRLNTSSPVPTKVLTRRNSSSDIASSSTPKVTRTRRSSVNQESEPVEDLDKKKATSTVRTRRSSITKASEPVQEESTPKSKRRASSVTKEQPAEVKPATRRRTSVSKEPEVEEPKHSKAKELVVEIKKTVKRRRSVTEDTVQVDEESTKKLTKSRSDSTAKRVDESKTKQVVQVTTKDVPGSTPFKKSPTSVFTESLDSIEETNQVNSPEESPEKLKRKNLEITKIDFDLSVINEASLTEEELSPQKRTNATDCESLPNKSNDQKKTPSKNISLTKEIIKEGDQKSTALMPNDVEASNVSTSSFSLDISSDKERDIDDKENVSPKKRSIRHESECEPMDVDNSVVELPSPIKKRLTQSPKVLLGRRVDELDHELEVAGKITDEMDKFLSEEIKTNSPKKSVKTQPEIVAVVEKMKSESSKDLATEVNGVGVEDKESLINETNDETLNGKPILNARENLSPEKNSDEKAIASVEKKTSVNEELEKVPENKDLKSENQEKLATDNSKEKPENSTSPLDKPHSSKTEELKKPSTASSIQTLAKQDSPPSQKESTHEEEATLKTVSVSEGPEKSFTKSITAEESVIFVNETPVKQITEEESVIIMNETPAKPITEESLIIVNETFSTPETAEINSKVVRQEENVLKNPIDESVIFVGEENTKTNSVQENDNTAKTSPTTDGKLVKVESSAQNLENKSLADKNSSITEKAANCDKSALSILATDEESEESVEIELTLEENESEDKPSCENKETTEEPSNENKETTEEQAITEHIENTKSKVELDAASSEDEGSYKSPTKKPRQNVISLSDHEMSLENENEKLNKSDVFETSIHSKGTLKEKPQQEVGNVNENNQNEEVDVENLNKSVIVYSTPKLAETKMDEDKIVKPLQEVSVLSNSSLRKSSDRTSITLQETMKLGETPEQGLSGRIHKYVDLFCAGIKNSADVSINVSLEYVGQSSDVEDENKTNMLEVSLTASDIRNKETECHKGSKRRKICHSSDNELESSELEYSITDETHFADEETETSLNVSKSTKVEEISSAKKSKKRRSNSDVSQAKENSFVKTSAKVSFLESKRTSTGTPKDENVKQANVAAIPLTPFKPVKDKLEESKADIEEESEIEEDDESIDEGGDDVYNKLFSTSLEENDPDDTTWVENESESDDLSGEEEEGEDAVLEEESSTIANKENSSDSSDDDVFSKPDEETKDPEKKKTHKLFRLSTYKIHLESSENEDDDNQQDGEKAKQSKVKNKEKNGSDNSTEEEPIQSEEKKVTPKNTKTYKDAKNKIQKREVVQVCTKQTKATDTKLRNSFESESIEVMMPESSEVASNRGKKRRLHNSVTVDDESLEKDLVNKKKKLEQVQSGELMKKHKFYNIKPSRGTSKNVKSTYMKPSTSTNDGWTVTIIKNI